MALVLDWQKKLGYSKDPFDAAVQTPTKRYIVGLEEIQQRINLFLIKDERIAHISGESGTGKTTLLKWIDEELAPQKSHAQHYIDAKQMPTAAQIIDTLIKSRITILEKTFSKVMNASLEVKEQFLVKKLATEKRNVFIIDNAGALEQQAIELLQDIVAKTPTHIILADTQGIKGVDTNLHIKIPTYRDDQLAELLRKRIENAGGRGTHPFDDDELASMFKASGRNPAKLLAIARERAIELSLKAAPAPKPAPSKFLTIKVEKKPVIDDMVVKDAPVKQPQEPQTAAEVAAALSQIVQQSEKPYAKKTPEPKPETVSLEHVVQALKKHPRRKADAAIENPKPKKTASKTKHDRIVEKLTNPKSVKKPRR